MKRTMLLAGLVTLMLCTSVLAAPSVALDGNLYVYMSDYNTAGGTHYANIAKLPWSAGTAGALNAGFFNTINQNNIDEQSYGWCNSNFDLYNHNLYLDVMETGSAYRRPTVWKVDWTTGAGTSVFVAANNDPGYCRSMAVDRTTGDIYFASSGNGRGVRLHDDVTPDGDYNDAGEETLLTMPGSLWSGDSVRQDAEFFGGWMYFTTGYTRTDAYFISRLRATPVEDCGLAVARTSFPTWTPGNWVDGPNYLAVGDPDGDGKPDIYAHLGYTESTTLSDVLGHWEDTNSDGIFSASEMIDSIALSGSGNGGNVRDVELVTDGTHSMIVYISTSSVVKYVNLLDNGAIGTETGTLFTTGLSPNNNRWIHLKMDQTVPAIPEPGTLLLIGTGALGALGWMRRRKMR